jgi:hypothetical protein
MMEEKELIACNVEYDNGGRTTAMYIVLRREAAPGFPTLALLSLFLLVHCVME